MLHYFDAIKSRGSADGYNSESPERLHIDYAKDAYRASNKRDYIIQMTVWLGRQEAVVGFRAYLDWLSEQDEGSDTSSVDGGESDIDNEEMAPIAPQVTSNIKVTHLISKRPGIPHLDVASIVSDFSAPRFLQSLETFIRRAYPPPQNPLLPNAFDRFDLYKKLSIRLPDLSAAGRHNAWDRIRATPLVPGRTSLEGLRVAQVRAIFTLPNHLRAPLLANELAYIEWFNPLRAPDPDSGLHSVSRASQTRATAAAVIPLTDIKSSCHLIPKYGTHFRGGWTRDTALEECKTFVLNKYISIAAFYELQLHHL
ncbi:hypothetical protein Hypma_000273 [Hypsizygus marmoreus]|uniref:Uncharacterized protein n=1 Tax=Hypsizygus marmoreus TaxID=39966 RepID=A0A369J8M0_HYPMA|nr:hypothetical protein Hypma_000273 [Hypsizygus marmoreus]